MRVHGTVRVFRHIFMSARSGAKPKAPTHSKKIIPQE